MRPRGSSTAGKGLSRPCGTQQRPQLLLSTSTFLISPRATHTRPCSFSANRECQGQGVIICQLFAVVSTSELGRYGGCEAEGQANFRHACGKSIHMPYLSCPRQWAARRQPSGAGRSIRCDVRDALRVRRVSAVRLECCPPALGVLSLSEDGSAGRRVTRYAPQTEAQMATVESAAWRSRPSLDMCESACVAGRLRTSSVADGRVNECYDHMPWSGTFPSCHLGLRCGTGLLYQSESKLESNLHWFITDVSS